jgi:beta-lactamase class A
MTSIYYRDFKNGPWILINGEETFTPASLLKVPIMIALYKLAETNPAILTEEFFSKRLF